MKATHCPDARDRKRAICGARPPLLAARVSEVTCKTCRSWPRLLESAFQCDLLPVPSAFARRLAAIGYLATAERIANDHEVTLDAIGSRSRRAPVARARRTLMLALRNLGLKYEAIGIIMARDHSTVVFQVRAAADPTYRERRRAA